MPICNSETFSFPAINRRKVEINFDGGNISSDGGILLLREIDRKIGLTDKISRLFPDSRDQGRITHSLKSMLQQRIYGLACGYEDCNDHDALRHDVALQTATDRSTSLASSPTLNRFENVSDRGFAVSSTKAMVDIFIESYKTPPKELILDFDGTDDLVHGGQEGKFYHGYYGNHCFLPLYVFCEKQLLVSYLRPSNIDGAKHSWAILSLLVKRFRQKWPSVTIIFRADGGFCRHKMLDWCDSNNVKYIVGMPRNKVLERKLAAPMRLAEEICNVSSEKARLFYSFSYKAKSWKRVRKIIGKAEHTSKGANPRFIVTNLEGGSRSLYDDMYCARGEMENRIKEQQLDLFADRTSCKKWWPNQMRLILSSLAYILIERMRSIALKGTKMANATAGSIRLKLLKIGAVITRNTRRITLRMASHCPHKKIFLLVAKKLAIE